MDEFTQYDTDGEELITTEAGLRAEIERLKAERDEARTRAAELAVELTAKDAQLFEARRELVALRTALEGMLQSFGYTDWNSVHDIARTQAAWDTLKATDPAPAPAAQKGRYLTIWRDGRYKVWRQGDAYYAQGDPDWFAEFNLDTLANESETK